MATIGRLVANLGMNLTEWSKGLSTAQRRLSSFEADFNRRSAAIERTHTKNTQRMSRSTNRMAGAFVALRTSALAPVAAAMGGLGVGRMADQMTLLTARIEQSTRSVQEFQFAYDSLATSAKVTGSGLQAQVEIFQRLSYSREQLAATVEEMTQFTDTVAKLGIVSGASPMALRAGLMQLGQGLSSGVLRAEELNSILENIPAVANEIAKQFGVATGDLRTLVLAGEVLSEDVFSAMINATAEVNEQFEKMPMTMGRAFNIALFGIQETLAGFNETTGASKFFANMILFIGKSFETVLVVADSFFSKIMKYLNFLYLGFNEFILQLRNLGNVMIEVANLLPGVEFGKLDNSAYIAESQRVFNNIQRNLANEKGSSEALADIWFPDEPTTEKYARKIVKDYQKVLAGIKEKDAKKGERDKVADTIADLQFRTEQLMRTNEQQELYNELKRAGVSLDSESGKVIADLVGEYQTLGKQIEFNKQIQEGFSDSFNDGLKDMIKGTGDLADAMRKLGNTIIDSLYDNLIGNKVSSFIGGIDFGSIFGFGGGKSVGGGVSAGTAYLVGENGPEMFIPQTGGRIMQNGQLSGSGASGTHITINVQDDVADSTIEKIRMMMYQEITKLRGEVPSISVNSVRDANRRNPGLLK